MPNKSLLPKYAFFVSGTGKHKDRLQAFDRALLNAGPLTHNLVAVSSILPAGCKIISSKKGLDMLTPGEIVFCIMAKQDTNITGEIASAAVGVVRDKRPSRFGYISEYHGNARNKKEASKIAKRLAVEMFSSRTKISSKKLSPSLLEAISASIKQPGNNEWVCSVALCIFVL